MTWEDFKKLEEECRSAGIVKDEALTQLQHMLQAKQAAKDSWEGYLRHMNEWEKNIAKTVRLHIDYMNKEKSDV